MPSWAPSDPTLNQAVLAYLERAPKSELVQYRDVAEVIYPGMRECAERRRVLNELWILAEQGKVVYFSHRGWRLK